MKAEQEAIFQILTGEKFSGSTNSKKQELLDDIALALGALIVEGARDLGVPVYIKPLFHNESGRSAVVIIAEGEIAEKIHRLTTNELKAEGLERIEMDQAEGESSDILFINQKSEFFH